MVSQRLRVPAAGGAVLSSPETSAPARSPGSAAPGTEAPGTGPLLGTPEMDHAVVERRFGGHMSVEPRKLMSEGWTSWQGHVVNGVLPLGRYLLCSNHSRVFLTVSAAPPPPEVAVKLLPTTRALAVSPLPRGERAGGH